MNRNFTGGPSTCCRRPRGRGDGPNALQEDGTGPEETPRTRGWTLAMDFPDEPKNGNPADAGMNLCRNGPVLALNWKPRGSGDGPLGAPFIPLNDHGNPAEAGIDPSPSGDGEPNKERPRGRGDEPSRMMCPEYSTTEAPPTRAVGRNQGRTFEFILPLPKPSNAGGRPPTRAKQAGKKTRKPSTQGRAAPKAKQTKPRTAPTPAPLEAERREQVEPKRKRTSTPARREQHRLNAQEHRRKAREQGLCVACRATAIPEQSRCEQCADRHRVDRRRWQANRKAAQ